MKLLVLAGCLLFIIFIQVRTNFVQARARPSFLINPQDLEPYTYATITGDNPNPLSVPLSSTVKEKKGLIKISESFKSKILCRMQQ